MTHNSAVKKVFNTKPLLREIRERIQVYTGERFVRVVVFGSTARNEARPDSDIDMMLFVRRLIPNDKEFIAEICAEVLFEYGVVLSLFCTTEADFIERPFNPLFQNIRREGVEV